MRIVGVCAALLMVAGLSGCGKTLDQLKTIGRSIIDVAGKTYEDVKDNVQTVKDTVKGATTPQK